MKLINWIKAFLIKIGLMRKPDWSDQDWTLKCPDLSKQVVRVKPVWNVKNLDGIVN